MQLFIESAEAVFGKDIGFKLPWRRCLGHVSDGSEGCLGNP